MVAPGPDFQLVTDIFSKAVQLEGDARRRLLDEECGDDGALRREVERMLSHDDVDAPDLFTDSRILEGRRALDRAAIRLIDDLPDRIGAWRVGARISSGGGGSRFRVTHADDERAARLVALETVADDALAARVAADGAILAALRDAALVEVHEVGLFDGKDGRRPYLITSLPPKRNLTRYVTDARLDPLGRAELVARVADAVERAHAAGLMHRALTAKHVLVEDDAAGAPRLRVDGVGVTAWTGHDLREPTSRELLTKAPEQANRDAAAVGPATDVYLLGLMAYDLIAGRPALDVIGRRTHEAVRILNEDPPPPMSRGDKRFPKRLEEAVGTALAKAPRDRHPTAAAFAAALRDAVRFERDRPRRVALRVGLGVVLAGAVISALAFAGVL